MWENAEYELKQCRLILLCFYEANLNCECVRHVYLIKEVFHVCRNLGNIKESCYSFIISIINKGSHCSYMECNLIHNCRYSVLLETAVSLVEWLSIISQPFTLPQPAKCCSFSPLWYKVSVLDPAGLSHSWSELRLRYSACTGSANCWFSFFTRYNFCQPFKAKLKACRLLEYNLK